MSRALFVGNFLSGSGIHRQYCEDLTERLEARRWQVVRTSREAGRIARLVDMLQVAWSRRHDYEIAHVDLFSGPAFVWAEAVCFELRRLGKPIVLSLHGGNLPQFSRRWPRRTRRLLNTAVIVTAPSSYLRDEMSHVTQDIVVVPNAIDVVHYPPRADRAEPRRLVWIRAFHSIYNPVMAVEVLAKLPARVTLDMIGGDKGDGSLAAVRTRARELGVEDRLQIIAGVPKSEVTSHLARGDVFLNTTHIDNTPVSVLEAMACGLAIVSTSVGGIPHLLKDGQDSLLVPPGDPDAMTRAIERLLAEPELATRLGSTAHQRALAFDWQPVLDQWERVLARAESRG